MGQFDHLHAFARRIGDAERVLSSGEGFFPGRSDEYLKLAIEVARSTLAGLRPAGVEPESWDSRIQALSRAIGCSLVSTARFRLHLGGALSGPAIRPDQELESGSLPANVDRSESGADLSGLTRAVPADEIIGAIADAWQEAFQKRVGEDLMERALGELSRAFETPPANEG